MRAARFVLCLGALATACSGSGREEQLPDATTPFEKCEASSQSFVRNAMLALLGRRPLSQAEVAVYAGVIDQLDALRAQAEEQGDEPSAIPDGRELVARALLDKPEFIDRWSGVVMDALRVPRIEDQSMASCYGERRRESDDGGALAAYVRDTDADDTAGDGKGRFGMLDLLRSALELDDLSPVYRAHLFALVSRPIPAANVPRVQAELARRQDFGNVFDAAYLNRDIVCLGCHNSEGAVTWHPEPDLNRHWAMPGLFEQAINGSSIGIEPDRAHAVFRFDGFVADDRRGVEPWGWTSSCGSFYPDSVPDDITGVDGFFAGITGKRVTVYDLEDALRRGFDKLAAQGLKLGPNGEIADPEIALAYLVSASIVENVWIEVIGTPLTTANHFPRNEASRDVLVDLTETFVASSYSLESVLLRIVTGPYFNRAMPEAGCGEPYNMPNVYDPWVISDEDPLLRRNSPADGIQPLSARTLLFSAYAALEWPHPEMEAFPETPFCDTLDCGDLGFVCSAFGACCREEQLYCGPGGMGPPGGGEAEAEQAFQRGVGTFLKNGLRGFRGLDFQARLMWETRFGPCENPGTDPDIIDRLVGLAESRGGTVRDLAEAIKDRLVGHGALETPEEEAVVADLFGAPLDAPAGPSREEGARRLCGVLLQTPQFLLQGMAAPDLDRIPVLTPDDASYGTVCQALAARGLGQGVSVTCEDGALTVTTTP